VPWLSALSACPGALDPSAGVLAAVREQLADELLLAPADGLDEVVERRRPLARKSYEEVGPRATVVA
jgi:hypothetical protein